MENNEVELYWDLTIQTYMTVTHNRPDIILVEKAIWKWTIIDIAVQGYVNVVRTEDWKVEKYQDIKFEVKTGRGRDSHSTSCDWSSRKQNQSDSSGQLSF